MASRTTWLLVLVLLTTQLPVRAFAQGLPPPGDALLGARLFQGAARFAHGGPPCIACHSAGTAGGTLGPDLTTVYTRYGGAKNLAPVLTTIPFPTMQPVFADHPLTAHERTDLIAYLSDASRATPHPEGARFLLLGALYALLLAAVTALVWRNRLTGVRRGLVRRSER